MPQQELGQTIACKPVKWRIVSAVFNRIDHSRIRPERNSQTSSYFVIAKVLVSALPEVPRHRNLFIPLDHKFDALLTSAFFKMLEKFHDI
jgi:hypothetical protein